MPDLCCILAYDNSMLGIQSYHLNICVCVFTLYRVTQKGGNFRDDCTELYYVSLYSRFSAIANCFFL